MHSPIWRCHNLPFVTNRKPTQLHSREHQDPGYKTQELQAIGIGLDYCPTGLSRSGASVVSQDFTLHT